MPYLLLIDGEYADDNAGSFSLGPEITSHTVTDRESARRILAYDLKNTADKAWSAEILQEWDAGKDTIQRENGPGHYFRAEYLP